MALGWRGGESTGAYGWVDGAMEAPRQGMGHRTPPTGKRRKQRKEACDVFSPEEIEEATSALNATVGDMSQLYQNRLPAAQTTSFGRRDGVLTVCSARGAAEKSSISSVLPPINSPASGSQSARFSSSPGAPERHVADVYARNRKNAGNYRGGPASGRWRDRDIPNLSKKQVLDLVQPKRLGKASIQQLRELLQHHVEIIHECNLKSVQLCIFWRRASNKHGVDISALDLGATEEKAVRFSVGQHGTWDFF